MDINKDKKLYLILGILAILILVILRNLITSGNDAVINYNELTSGYQIVRSGTETKDREIYYIVQDILINMSNAYSGSSEQGTEIEDYYNVLNKSYRNKIGKTKYIELVDKFFKKLTIVDSGGMGAYSFIQIMGSIKGIYELEQDEYVAVLQLGDYSELAYFGVTLDTDNNTYEIFYIE